MIRNPRKRVVRFDMQPQDPTIPEAWGPSWAATLECGHIVSIGRQETHRPKIMACAECGAAGQAREVGLRRF